MSKPLTEPRGAKAEESLKKALLQEQVRELLLESLMDKINKAIKTKGKR